MLLNVTPDHLDRHGTLEALRRAKLRVFERQAPGDTAVLCDDDPFVAALAADAVPGAGRACACAGAERPPIARGLRGLGRWPAPTTARMRLRTDRRVRAPAPGASGALEALRAFQPLAHRLEQVRDVAGATYVNDSKATNVDATLQALASFRAACT